MVVFSIFSYEIKEYESLVLNIDAKYYKREAEKPFSGIGLFSNEYSYYFGSFKDGMKEGYGENISLGALYVGEFKKGLFEGKGILKSPEGKILEGTWKRSEFVKEEKTEYRENLEKLERQKELMIKNNL